MHRWICALLLVFIAAPGPASAFQAELADTQLVALEDRDVLVLRSTGQLNDVTSYARDEAGLTLSFVLRGTGKGMAGTLAGSGEAISGVDFDMADPAGVTVNVRVADVALLDKQQFRFTKPSRGVIVLEMFPVPGSVSADALEDIDSVAPPPETETTPEAPVLDSGGGIATELGLPSIDLSSAPAERVLGLAADTGLLDLNAPLAVATENMGEVVVAPAGQSLTNWTGRTPPGELFLAGTPEQLAEFIAGADASQLGRLPTLSQVWEVRRPKLSRSKVAGLGNVTPDMRSRVKDDPYAGLYYADTMPGDPAISDVYVTLPAMNGANLYDVINYLSEVSGISIVIDPYAFEPPTGYSRNPLPPEQADGGGDEPGFRQAQVYDPQTMRSGTVMGNFNNVPFDTALRLILETHGLEYVVMNQGPEKPRAQAGGGRPAGSGGRGGGESYEKPVILITSKERLEQELGGQNEVDLYQVHYADPFQITEILRTMNMLPSETSGWYIYGGSFGGGGGTGGGFGGSGGGTGGGGGFTMSSRIEQPGIRVYRGSSREPVYAAVRDAEAAGLSLLHVRLQPEQSMLVSLLAVK